MSKTITVQQLGDAVNANVIQLETRVFPSLVIQGDSMSVLYGMVRSALRNAQQATAATLEECVDELMGVEEILLGYLVVYEQRLIQNSLIQNGIPLPYNVSYQTEAQTHE